MRAWADASAVAAYGVVVSAKACAVKASHVEEVAVRAVDPCAVAACAAKAYIAFVALLAPVASVACDALVAFGAPAAALVSGVGANS